MLRMFSLHHLRAAQAAEAAATVHAARGGAAEGRSSIEEVAQYFANRHNRDKDPPGGATAEGEVGVTGEAEEDDLKVC